VLRSGGGGGGSGEWCLGDSRKRVGGSLGEGAWCFGGAVTVAEGVHRLENFRPCLTLRGTALW